MRLWFAVVCVAPQARRQGGRPREELKCTPALESRLVISGQDDTGTSMPEAAPNGHRGR
jgi:hypothetical protein